MINNIHQFAKKTLRLVLLRGVLTFGFCGIFATVSSAHGFCFTRFSIYDSKGEQVLDVANHPSKRKIIVPARRKFLEVEFSNPKPQAPQTFNYYYTLDDSGEQWTFLGKGKNTLTFHSLEKGKHRLWVKAENPKSPRDRHIIFKEIYVRAHFHESMLFLPLILLLALIALAITIRKKRKFLQKKKDLRVKISSDLHDEIGSTLTRISLGVDLLSAGILNPSEEKQVLENVSSLGQNVTSIISDVIWFESDGNSKNKFLIDRMREEANQLFESTNIDFHFKINNINYEAELPLEYRRSIYLIFKEALNNVIKHSNATQVNAYFTQKNGKYIMQVSDNGTQSSNNIKKGQGLSNMALRTERINGIINISRENGYSIRLETQFPQSSSSSKSKGISKK